jgi:hypothetical protein
LAVKALQLVPLSQPPLACQEQLLLTMVAVAAAPWQQQQQQLEVPSTSV